MKRGNTSVFETNIIYLIVAGILLTLGSYVQGLNLKSGLIITEYILILLPVIIYLKLKGASFKTTLKLKKLRLKHGLMIVGATLLNYPIALFFNLIMMTIISMFSEIQPLPIPTATSFGQYLGLFFIIAISAGICEEVFFRGMLLSVYEKEYGGKEAIIITAILFGIFHFNPQNLLAPIVLGLFFGYLVQLTGSIYAGIIGHIANNGIAVTLGYILNLINQRLNSYININETATNQSITTIQLGAATITMGIIASICGVFTFLIVKAIKKDFQHEEDQNHWDDIEDNIEDNKIEIKSRKSLSRFIPVTIVIFVYFFIAYIQLK